MGSADDDDGGGGGDGGDDGCGDDDGDGGDGGGWNEGKVKVMESWCCYHCCLAKMTDELA